MTAEVRQLQRKAERQRMVQYEPEFALDVAELDRLSEWSSRGVTTDDVMRAVREGAAEAEHVAALLSPAAEALVEDIARASRAVAVRRFGRTMHLFAPLYVSNECVSECTYCGFQVWNRDIVRRTLSVAEIGAQTRYLKSLGFRHVLLVSGEHPRHSSADHLRECVRACAAEVPHVSIEVQAWDEPTYASFVDAGCDGLVIYQECYDERRYPDYHVKGNKRFFGWRLGAPERAARAGMRRLGIGALLGLDPDWRFEVLALTAHARFLVRRAWRSDLTVALPRLEPAAGFEHPPHVMSDRQFVLATCALRLALPDVGIVLSTREPPRVRDGLARIGVTHMSAGSRTEPGGYTEPGNSQEQFEISDHRSPAEIDSVLSALGYDAVWKDDSPALRRTADDRI